MTVAGIGLVPDLESRSCAPSARYPRSASIPSTHSTEPPATDHDETPAENPRSNPWARSVSNDPSHQAGGARDVEPRSDAELVVGTGLGVGARVGPLALHSSKDPSSRVSKPSKNTATSKAVKLGTGAAIIQGRSLEANKKNLKQKGVTDTYKHSRTNENLSVHAPPCSTTWYASQDSSNFFLKFRVRVFQSSSPKQI